LYYTYKQTVLVQCQTQPLLVICLFTLTLAKVNVN